MLHRLDKSWPYVLLLVLGYLTYTTLDRGNLELAKGKGLPTVAREALNPKLLEPEAHASPADRDPFEVHWASYLNTSQAPGATTRTASAPAVEPTEPTVPPLRQPLLAVIHRQDLRLAVIGDNVCKVGSLIGGDDPKKCWQVVAIEKDAVIVTFGKVQRVLRIARPPGPSDVPAADGRSEVRQ